MDIWGFRLVTRLSVLDQKQRILLANFRIFWGRLAHPLRNAEFRLRVFFLIGMGQFGLGRRREMIVPIALEQLPVVYISLQTREDRRALLVEEFKSVGLRKADWFRALERKNGALGCALSHLDVIRSADGLSSLVMICEDDIGFLCSSRQLQEILDDFAKDPMLDVLQLDARTHSRHHRYDGRFNLVNDGHSTGCYVVKPGVADVLERFFSKSVDRLERGVPLYRAAIDVVWKIAQQRHLVFATPVERVVIHKSGFSDVSGGYAKLDT